MYLTAIVTVCLGTSFATDAWRSYLAKKAAAQQEARKKQIEGGQAQ